MELDISKALLDKSVGYLYVYQPNHPMSNASGKIYVHRYNAERHYGIKLTSDLVVHHKDENKLNNEPDNLQIMTHEEHGKHHNNDRVEISCSHCGEIVLIKPSSDGKYCSHLCYSLANRKFDITKESLQKLVDEKPITHIAKLFGISDVAIHKRCKILGIAKKPRGFFLRK